MTLYFMGTELEDFPNRAGTSIAHSTNSNYRKLSNTRQVVGVTDTTNVEDSQYIDTDTFSATDFWTHFVVGSNTPSLSVPSPFKWYSGGTQKLRMRWTNASGTIELSRWNGSAWVVLGTVTDFQMWSMTTLVLSGVPATFDFYIKSGNPGDFRCYINGAPAISLTGIDLSGVGTIDKFRMQPWAGTIFFSEVIVATWNTLFSKIVMRFPTGNGTYQEWTNGGFGIVDDLDALSADVAVSPTADQRTTYTHAAFTALAANEVIGGVKVAIAANRDAAGPQNINIMTRIGGTTDYHDSNQALNVSQTRLSKMWETSPASAVAWTMTELNAAQFGVRSRT